MPHDAAANRATKLIASARCVGVVLAFGGVILAFGSGAKYLALGLLVGGLAFFGLLAQYIQQGASGGKMRLGTRSRSSYRVEILVRTVLSAAFAAAFGVALLIVGMPNGPVGLTAGIFLSLAWATSVLGIAIWKIAKMLPIGKA
jgi:hypothetical protein